MNSRNGSIHFNSTIPSSWSQTNRMSSGRHETGAMSRGSNNAMTTILLESRHLLRFVLAEA